MSDFPPRRARAVPPSYIESSQGHNILRALTDKELLKRFRVEAEAVAVNARLNTRATQVRITRSPLRRRKTHTASNNDRLVKR